MDENFFSDSDTSGLRHTADGRGYCDEISPVDGGARVTAWALFEDCGRFISPKRFLIANKGRVIGYGLPDMERPDVLEAIDENAPLLCGFSSVVPGDLIDGDPVNDIQIMSMSFTGGYSEAEATAIDAAWAEGILPIAAAGNSAGAVGYPAALDNCMAISGSTITDGWYTYSCYGNEIELIAPAVSVLSTVPGGAYSTMTGTSMACPHVAGVAALIWSDNPEFTNEEVRLRLNSTAEDIGMIVERQGNGLVDAENAVMGTTNGDN